MDKKPYFDIDPSKHPTFISYSWDSDEHIEWVMHFAHRLEEKGIQVIIDKKSFHLGDPLPRMMEKAITECEYVLFVCTPNYKEKSDNHIGGVAYEDTIITGEIYEKQNHRKYIPIFREKDISKCLPNWAKGKYGVIFSNPTEYESSMKQLVNEINPSGKCAEREGFYFFSPDTQILILNSFSSILINADNSYGTTLEELLVYASSLDPERLQPDVRSELRDLIAELEHLYSIMLEEINQECGCF